MTPITRRSSTRSTGWPRWPARRASGAPLCGEMAADPLNAVLLLGLGISDFSLSAPSIPVVKQAIRSVSLATAREIAAAVLAMDSGEEIRRYLEKARGELMGE